MNEIIAIEFQIERLAVQGQWSRPNRIRDKLLAIKDCCYRCGHKAHGLNHCTYKSGTIQQCYCD